MQTHSLGNILREKLIDNSKDFTDEDGFFIRSAGGGSVTYCPLNNLDSETITKTLPASASFQDPVICRKIVAGQLDDLYVGYGV